MATILILLYLVKIPFPTGPIHQQTFPTSMEAFLDTSSVPNSRSTFTWPEARVMVESLEVARGAYDVSSWILDGDGYIREKRRPDAFSDTLIFVERFEYEGRELRHWQGQVEAADCFYAGGRLDSVHLVNTDSEDAETYYFKIAYDSSGRLARVDRVTVLPVSRELPIKRYEFEYGEAGSATLRISYPGSGGPSGIRFLDLPADRLTAIRSQSADSPAGEVRLVRRFLYPTGSALRGRSPSRAGLHPRWSRRIDLLGRKWRPAAGREPPLTP